jgi:hypothetical protein
MSLKNVETNGRKTKYTKKARNTTRTIRLNAIYALDQSDNTNSMYIQRKASGIVIMGYSAP